MKKLFALFLIVAMMAALALPTFAMTITVAYGETTYEIAADGDDLSIDDIKQKNQDKWGMAPDQQRLLYNGVKLIDGRMASAYGIQDGDTLQLFSTTEALASSPASGKGEGDYSINIGATYKINKPSADAVISVEISWDNMSFEYSQSTRYNSTTHKNELYGGEWEERKSKIQVANHSNVPVNAGFAFTASEGVTTTGGFYELQGATEESEDTYQALATDAQKLSLGSAKGLEDAPNANIYFGVSGDAISEDKTLGTITVTIAVPDSVIEDGANAVYTAQGFTNAMKAGGNIKLGTNISLSNALELGDRESEEGKDISLNLNGNCLTGELAVYGGSLTVSDSVGTGKITSSDVTISIYGGTVWVEGGTVESTGYIAIRLEHNNAWLSVAGGTIIGKYYRLDHSNGTAKIQGGSIQGGYAIQFTCGSLTVTAGEVIGTERGIFLGGTCSGSVSIEGGTVKGGENAVRNDDNRSHDGATVAITGGTFYGSVGGASSEGIDIYRGTFDSNVSGIDNVWVRGTLTDNGDGTWTVG